MLIEHASSVLGMSLYKATDLEAAFKDVYSSILISDVDSIFMSGQLGKAPFLQVPENLRSE